MSTSVIATADSTRSARFHLTAVTLVNVTVGETLLRLATFALAISIARQHGADMFGFYAAALAASTFLTTLADNGLQVAALEQLSKRRGANASLAYSQLLLAKLLLSALAGLVLVLAPAAMHASAASLTIWLLVSLRTVLQSFAQLNFAALKALRRTAAIGYVQTGHAVCLLAVTFLVYSRHDTLVVLLAGAVFCQVLELAAAQLSLRQAGVNIVSASVISSLRVARDNAPLGLTATVSALVLRLDVLCLSVFASVGQLGLYAAAQWPVIAIYLAAWLFGSIALTDMATIASNQQALGAYVRRWSVRILWITVPAAAVAYWAAPILVPRFFGQQFRGAATISSVLVLAAPFIFLNTLRLNRAIAQRDARVYAAVYLSTIVVAAIVVCAAAKWLGMTGVALAATAREIGLFLVLSVTGRGGR